MGSNDLNLVVELAVVLYIIHWQWRKLNNSTDVGGSCTAWWLSVVSL